ncbi:MAG: ABC transporter substrate-binding protein [Rhodobacteraceae bacterium]|nr:ABC transporter substrate-binding protein [Paracoccaceae bacterium]
MKTRRDVLTASVLALGAALAPALPALADTAWPEKPVRILVSFPPGGSSDLVARLLGEKLGDSLGQNFVVENKPGAAGTVAANALKDAEPDGYTFMLSNLTPFSVAPTRFPDTPYDPVADFTHVSYIGTVYLGLFVSPKLGITSLGDYVKQAVAEPGKFEYGSSGVGSWGHIIAEQFQDETGAELLHVPYKGSGPMRLDFRGEFVTSIFDAVPQNLPAVEDGTAIALAVSSPRRIDTLPDVPTFTEMGYDIVAENWLGMSAPAGLDPEIATKLDAALAEAMADPEGIAQFDTWGLVHEPKTSAEFSDYVAAQFEAWKPLVAAAMN